MSKRKSWVWSYEHRDDDKAICNICGEQNNNAFSCADRTTGSINRHLKLVHNVYPTNAETSATSSDANSEYKYEFL